MEPGPWQRVRGFDRRHPLSWDVAPAVALVVLSVATHPAPFTVSTWAAVLIGHAPLVLRRRFPVPALAITLVAVLLLTLAEDELYGTTVAVLMLLFNAGLRERGPRLVAVGLAVLAVVVAGEARSDPLGEDLGERTRSLLSAVAVHAAALLLGLQIRGRRAYLTMQREEAAHAAVVAERSRIAQEMHDIIGHNLSVIASLSTGGAVAVRTSPADAEEVFGTIGSVSRSSLRDVRRVLAVLRHDTSPNGISLGPQPGLVDLAGLVESVRAAGVHVTFERSGDVESLSPGRQLAVFRTVQESLTNTLRHVGPGARAWVRVARTSHDVAVTVTDDGPAGPRAGPGLTGAHGILGMRERAEAYDGELDAGPFGAGWRVRARIPVDER